MADQAANAALLATLADLDETIRATQWQREWQNTSPLFRAALVGLITEAWDRHRPPEAARGLNRAAKVWELEKMARELGYRVGLPEVDHEGQDDHGPDDPRG